MVFGYGPSETCSQTTRRRRWASFMSVVGHRGHESSPRAAISVGDSFSFVRPALGPRSVSPAAESRFRRPGFDARVSTLGAHHSLLRHVLPSSQTLEQIKRAPIAANCCCWVVAHVAPAKSATAFSFQLRPVGLKAPGFQRSPLLLYRLICLLCSLSSPDYVAD